jgi:hypothetical protein
MRILQVGKYYAPVRGGIENLVHALSRGLAREHEVTALVFNRGRETVQETMEGVRVIRVGSLGLVQSVEIAPAFLRWIGRIPTDMITVHMPNPLGELATWLSRPTAGLVLMYRSDIVRQRALRLLYSPFLKAILRRADRIIVTSRRYMESSETLRPYRVKCAVIPLGLDLDDYVVTPEVDARAAELRREHGEEMVLFVGRLVYDKGVDVLSGITPQRAARPDRFGRSTKPRARRLSRETLKFGVVTPQDSRSQGGHVERKVGEAEEPGVGCAGSAHRAVSGVSVQRSEPCGSHRISAGGSSLRSDDQGGRKSGWKRQSPDVGRALPRILSLRARRPPTAPVATPRIRLSIRSTMPFPRPPRSRG